MLTAVDHLVVNVTDVARAVETYRALGFTVTDADVSVRGEERRVAQVVFENFYIEFRPVGDRPGALDEATEGSHLVVLRSDALDLDVERLRSAGFRVSEPVDYPITTRLGSSSRLTAFVDAGTPVGLVEDHPGSNGASDFLGTPPVHPNTATVVERVYLAVESIDLELERFEQLLGMSAPQPEMGTVIMSLMSVFYFGDIGIAVAEPRGPGPTATALAARGPGLFQVLLRADHLDVAAAEMVGRGAPAPARGTRLSGESALLVDPADACNVYVAFAGQP